MAMKKEIWCSVFVVLLLGILVGCQVPGNDASILTDPVGTTAQTDAVQCEIQTNFVPPVENRMVSGDYYPLSNDKGVFRAIVSGSNVSYYDFESQDSMFLCVQPGCSHEDESCLSYQGTILDFAEYDGYWYTLSSDSDCSVKLIQTNPSTNQRKILCIFEDKDYTYSAKNLVLSYGSAWFEITRISLAPVGTDEDGHDYYDVKNSLMRIQLNSGEVSSYSGEKNSSQYQFLGSSATQAAMVHLWLDTETMSFNEYNAQQPDSSYEDYLLYLAQAEFTNTRRQLLLVDLVSGLEQEICSDIRPTDLSCCYGDELYYRTIDQDNGLSQIWKLNLNSGENALVWEDTWIINYWVVDQKLFCIISQEENSIEYYCIDLLTGQKLLVDNNGQVNSIYFSLYAETTDKFIGYVSDGRVGYMAWIFKEAFWNGQYDQLVALR